MIIENYRKFDNHKTEIARFDVILENIGLTLHEFKVVRGKNGWFIAPPNFSYEKAGVKMWAPYFSVSENRKKEFFEKLKDLVNEKIGEEDCV